MLPDKTNTICRLETKAAVDSRPNHSPSSYSADTLEHFIALRGKSASNNAGVPSRSAAPFKVASLPFTAAERWFLTYPSSLCIIQCFACDKFNLVYMLSVSSGDYTVHTLTAFLLVLWICRCYRLPVPANICISQTIPCLLRVQWHQ